MQSVGAYGIENTPKPLLNYSQEICGIPVDTVPPCAPALRINNLCFDASLNSDDFSNYLSWSNPLLTCSGKKDLYGYRIYYKRQINDAYQLLAEIKNGKDTTFRHQQALSIAGCYVITAFDSLNNESKKSNEICIDNCPDYKLPNAFTPNGDNQNDLFKPYPYRFISRIELTIYNRWGGQVFQSTDPNINWEGKDSNGNEVSAGVYYYTCKVFEQRVEGEVERPEMLTGYIQLVK